MSNTGKTRTGLARAFRDVPLGLKLQAPLMPTIELLSGQRVPPRVRRVAAPTHPGYTIGMKTAISLPDDVFAEADSLARRLKKSRSQIYREALREYFARHDPDSVTAAMNRVCAEVDTRPDPAVSAAARRILERSEW